jgi:mycoredoxin
MNIIDGMRRGFHRLLNPMFHGDTPEFTPDDLQAVTVYWRPGCPFCSSLRGGLRAMNVPFTEVNIWDDPQGAAYVRSVARGNETVPTVRIGDIGLVNPSPNQVIAAALQPA